MWIKYKWEIFTHSRHPQKETPFANRVKWAERIWFSCKMSQLISLKMHFAKFYGAEILSTHKIKIRTQLTEFETSSLDVNDIGKRRATFASGRRIRREEKRPKRQDDKLLLDFRWKRWQHHKDNHIKFDKLFKPNIAANHSHRVCRCCCSLAFTGCATSHANNKIHCTTLIFEC